MNAIKLLFTDRLSGLREVLRVLRQPRYGCLFWSDTGSGEVFGNYGSFQSFSEDIHRDFERWGIKNPIIIVGPAWRVRLVQLLLRGSRPGFATKI